MGQRRVDAGGEDPARGQYRQVLGVVERRAARPAQAQRARGVVGEPQAPVRRNHDTACMGVAGGQHERVEDEGLGGRLGRERQPGPRLAAVVGAAQVAATGE